MQKFWGIPFVRVKTLTPKIYAGWNPCISIYLLSGEQIYLWLFDLWQIWRILRPLVPGTLFLARSLGSRGALCNERKRRIACCREALSPLRPSIWGNRNDQTLQQLPYKRASQNPISFFLRRDISRSPRDQHLLLVLPLPLPSFAKVSLCRKEIEDSRGVL